jgi:hypothetical protein
MSVERESIRVRLCFECGNEIKESMGFVVAGDMEKAMKEQLPMAEVRERCFRCVELKSKQSPEPNNQPKANEWVLYNFYI